MTAQIYEAPPRVGGDSERARRSRPAPILALVAILTLLGLVSPANAVDYKLTVYRINKVGNQWRSEARPIVNNRAVSLGFNGTVSTRNESIPGGYTLKLRTLKSGTTNIFMEYTLTNPNNPFNDPVIGVNRGLSQLSSPGGNTRFSNVHFYSNVSSTRKLWVSLIEATFADAQALIDAEINLLKGSSAGDEKQEPAKGPSKESDR